MRCGQISTAFKIFLSSSSKGRPDESCVSRRLHPNSLDRGLFGALPRLAANTPKCEALFGAPKVRRDEHIIHFRKLNSTLLSSFVVKFLAQRPSYLYHLALTLRRPFFYSLSPQRPQRPLAIRPCAPSRARIGLSDGCNEDQQGAELFSGGGTLLRVRRRGVRPGEVSLSKSPEGGHAPAWRDVAPSEGKALWFMGPS